MSGDGFPRLTGVRVLVTRPRERSEELWFLLEDEGAEVVSLPLLEQAPPDDLRPLTAAAEQLQRYPWVMFSSASGVHGLVEAAREAGTLSRLKSVKLCTVGAGTSRAVRDHGLEVAVEADLSTGLGLFDKVRLLLEKGDEVLLPVAQEGRWELHDALLEAAMSVTRVAAYKSLPSPVSEETLGALRENAPDIILFSSPRAVEALLELARERSIAWIEHAKFVAIGPTTAAALTERGMKVSAIADKPSAEGLVEASVRAVGR